MISIIIPTYNRETSLLRIIFALALNNEHIEHEIIVANDGRPLSPAANRVLAAIPRLRIVESNAGNVSLARNAGAAIAKGAVLAFLDDDVIPMPSWLSLVERSFATKGATPGGLTGRVTSLNPGMRTLDRLRAKIYEAREARIIEGACTQDLGHPAYRVNFMSGGNCAVSARYFTEVGGFSGHYTKSQDRDLALKIVKSGREVFFLPELEVLHDNGFTDWYGLIRGRFLSGYFAVGLQHDHSGFFNVASEKLGNVQRSGNLLETFAQFIWGSSFNAGLYVGHYRKQYADAK